MQISLKELVEKLNKVPRYELEEEFYYHQSVSYMNESSDGNYIKLEDLTDLLELQLEYGDYGKVEIPTQEG
jgi:hypothetical protein